MHFSQNCFCDNQKLPESLTATGIRQQKKRQLLQACIPNLAFFFQIVVISNSSRSETPLQLFTFLNTKQKMSILTTNMRHKRVRQQIYPMILSCRFKVAKISLNPSKIVVIKSSSIRVQFL